MGFFPVMKQDNMRETFVCRSFTCCRTWEGTISTAGSGRKVDHDEGSWVLEDWVSCHAIQANSILRLMIIWVCLILWVTDLKLSNLICCVTEHSQMLLFTGCESPVHTAIYSGKMALSISSWASNSSCRHFALGVCPSVFFCNMDTMSPLLIQLVNDIEKKTRLLMKCSDTAAARGIGRSLRKLVPFCSAEDLIVFIL